MKTLKTFLIHLGSALGLLASFAAQATMDDELARIQHDWASAYYQVPKAQKEAAFNRLGAAADALRVQYPQQAEPLIWHAIVLSSAAKFSGGLGALGMVKQARDELLQAEKLNAGALGGSVYSSLGSLYAKVPGWPIGFGDKDKASGYLKKALQLNPQGIDPNFFYAELLADRGDRAGARHYYEQALAAPPRAGREDADSGRRQEIREALARLDP